MGTPAKKDMISDAINALPASWQARLAGKTIVPVSTGMSGAAVFRVSAEHAIDHYLKIGTGTVADLLRQEIERTKWLASAAIRVPRVLAHWAKDNVVAVAMSPLEGRSAEQIGDTDWRPAVAAVARAFARLHSLPVATCPFDERLQLRLARASALVHSDAIDPAEFDERNADLSPQQLYDRVASRVPEHEDCVVTHGDATWSNLILGDDGQLGFVDCGHCGRADRYVDLALLAGELQDRLGTNAFNTFTAAYGDLRWDESKAEFYRDLYEFF
jgi:aminoglycoside 3'-phosphotransferase-2